MNAVELTRELVRIDTVNPVSPERPAAERVGRLLEGAGFAVRMHEFAPGRTSVVARRDGGGPPLCFAGHLDTVPLGAAPCSRDPFGGEIDAGNAAHLARTEGALGSAGAMIVGEPTGNVPVLGHKGALWLHARTRGVTAHGSMPDKGVNAVVKAAHAVLSLAGFRFDVAPDPLLGGPTLNVGTIRGGLNVNSVPDEAVIGIDIRTIPAQRHAELRKRLAELLGDEVELTPVVDLPGMRTAEENPFVQSVMGAVARVTGERRTPGSATYFTDASVLTPAFGGIPTVVLGPGEMALCHQTDEHCRVERIEQAVAAYLEIARSWCGA